VKPLRVKLTGPPSRPAGISRAGTAVGFDRVGAVRSDSLRVGALTGRPVYFPREERHDRFRWLSEAPSEGSPESGARSRFGNLQPGDALASSGTVETIRRARPLSQGARARSPRRLPLKGRPGLFPPGPEASQPEPGGGDTPAQARRVGGESVGTPSDPS